MSPGRQTQKKQGIKRTLKIGHTSAAGEDTGTRLLNNISVHIRLRLPNIIL
jgi:hypothetical protein